MANGLNIFSLGWFRGVFSFYHAMQNFFYQSLSLLFLWSQYQSFLQGSRSFAELVYDGFVKPLRTAAFTRNIAAATLLHVSHMPAIKV